MIAARDDFLAVVSHDLRGMLGARTFANKLVFKALADDERDRAGQKHAITSDRIVSRMTRMLDDLLDLSSIEAGRLAVIPAGSDIDALVAEVVAAFGPIADAKGVALTAELVGAMPRTELDHDRILQVLANLVSNAVRYTPAAGRITVGVTATDEGVRFEVEDTRVGMAATDLERVFERFRQLGRDRRGLGLGLHISKCIVEAHGGRIWAESELGVGSTMYFILPSDAALPSVTA